MSDIRVSTSGVAVDYKYPWQPIETCPRGVKVQLLGAGGIPVYGNWNGTDSFWVKWAPLPCH